MNHHNELILGFEVKEMWNGSGWAQNRKDKYLYRLDVEKVLSTDNMVWGTVYADLYWITKSHVSLPYIGPYGFWENLSELYAFLEKYRVKLKSKRYYIVLFTMTASVCSEKDLQHWDTYSSPYNDDLEKNSVEWAKSRGVKIAWDDSWKLLGYDVSDHAGSISGLTNCGVSKDKDEAKSLREKWGPHLNKYHLFDDVNKAFEYKKYIDPEVPSHAPFYVYGIWFVKEWVG